jgi:hypothetical protein
MSGYCRQYKTKVSIFEVKRVAFMKKFNHWYQNLSVVDVTWYMAIFVTAMLGTLVSGLVLRWGMENFGDQGPLARLGASLAATAAYAAVGLVVFYAVSPKVRLALKRFWINKE